MLMVTGTASLIRVLSIGPSVKSIWELLRFAVIFVFDLVNLSCLFPKNGDLQHNIRLVKPEIRNNIKLKMQKRARFGWYLILSWPILEFKRSR